MAGARQPVELIIAKGKKHLTKTEIEERLSEELTPNTDNISPPDYLTKSQTDEFINIAVELLKLKIMGNTDVDALARFIIAKDFYVHAIKQLRKANIKNNPDLFDKWSKIQDKYFKQCRASANDLGLSISSRCKLVVPNKEPEKPKENKFKKFKKINTG